MAIANFGADHRPGRLMRIKVFWIATLVVMMMPASLAAQQAGIEQAVRTITEADYIERVGIIAHDSMQGRDTPSEGLNKTARWIASEFQRLGLRGGGDDGEYIQSYPLRALIVDRNRSTLRGSSAGLAYGRDIIPLMGPPIDGEATGELVLVSGSANVSQGLANGVVRDKHAVVVFGEDEGTLNQSMFQRGIAVRNAGAASVLLTTSMDQAIWDGNAAQVLAPQVTRGWVEQVPTGGTFRPIMLLRNASLDALLRGRDIDLDALRARESDELRVDPGPEITFTLTQVMDEAEIRAPNVVGILEGSDPVLKDEYIVFSAHMDHVGIGSPDQNGDSIFNGADDDASGTVAVVEIAEAMAVLPESPRRSMIFLLVSGEEKGLWGSEYYADHPSVPTEGIVANLNIDMVARNWTDTIVAIGKEHSDLGVTLERVNSQHPELGMTAIDDLWPEENFYRRSDHYNFARKGVPVLFFFNGTHDDYHGRDDEVDRIDAEKAARVAKLIYYLGIEVGNAEERPTWNPESYARIVSDRSQ